jgi:hypothetical protein
MARIQGEQALAQTIGPGVQTISVLEILTARSIHFHIFVRRLMPFYGPLIRPIKLGILGRLLLESILVITWHEIERGFIAVKAAFNILNFISLFHF